MEKKRVAFILTQGAGGLSVCLNRRGYWLCPAAGSIIVIDMPDEAVSLSDKEQKDFLFDYWDKHKQDLIQQHIANEYPDMVESWQVAV